MTVFTGAQGRKYIKWDLGDEIDWTTPDIGDGINHEYCGNCGLDVPGCGCPRDCDFCRRAHAYCGHLDAGADDPDWGPR